MNEGLSKSPSPVADKKEFITDQLELVDLSRDKGIEISSQTTTRENDKKLDK